jgi:hypothetical protein
LRARLPRIPASARTLGRSHFGRPTIRFFGDLPCEHTRRSIELFARDVIPGLRRGKRSSARCFTGRCGRAARLTARAKRSAVDSLISINTVRTPTEQYAFAIPR